QGATADYLDPQQMDAMVKEETARWTDVVKATNIEAE
ncbi:MAG TPA: tripartite tricarboxylate transporter substrate binding protein, partial [Lautropia sp.]|nr:tripartite tricarboxylate transporter substrate binding protein [Lautropia sp.]